MACKGCRGGNSGRHTSGSSDLRKFAFLSPRQLRLLKELEDAEAKNSDSEESQ